MQSRELKLVHPDLTKTYTELLKVSGMYYLYHQRIHLLASEMLYSISV